MIWDFTCADSLAASHIAGTSQQAGRAAQQAESRKHATYQDLKATYHFIPVAVETLGPWGQEALKFIKDLGARISELTGEKKSTNYLFQALGMANQRGNAISISGTVPSARKLDEIYYL